MHKIFHQVTASLSVLANCLLLPSCARPQPPDIYNKKYSSVETAVKTEPQLPVESKGTTPGNSSSDNTVATKSPDSIPPGTLPATGSTVISFTPIRYADAQYPAFIYAIWVTDANNKYIKSIGARAATRMRYLDKWLAAAGVVAPTQPDGVTGASITYPATAIPVSVIWDMKDKAGAFVPQGDYNINIQMTSANNTGMSLTIPTTINASGMMKTDTTMTTGITAVSAKHTP